MKKKYPAWFSAYSKPVAPLPPSETIIVYDVIKKINLHTWDTLDFENPAEADSISVEANYDRYEGGVSDVDVIFSKKRIAPNPNYNKQLKDYLNRMEEYKERSKEWNAIKKQYDADNEAAGKEQRRKQYEKLKKEFE